MRLVCEVREHEGKVYAVHRSHRFATPTGDEQWWLLATSPGIFDVGSSAVWDSARRVYDVDYNGVGERTRAVSPASSEYDPKADRVVEFDVPPPKTKLDVRWRDGRWEKRYAGGWR